MARSTDVADARDAQARALDDRILRFIGSREPADVEFERLALACFEYQYERCEPYRRLCDRAGRAPGVAKSWLDVPPVQTASFGASRLACFPPDRATLTFTSSGTTSSGSRPSTLELDSAVLYEASLLTHFQARVLPDRAKLRIFALMPSRTEAPSSSLSYMAHCVIDALGEPGSGFFVRDGALAFDDLRDALDHAPPALVFGTAFAFVHLFDRCREDGLRFALPPGSRVVETGGFKGKSREVPRDELYAAFGDVLGVPREMCASEYGMCELGSQWYDATIADRSDPRARAPRLDVKVGPHWARSVVVDPVTAMPLQSGREGLVRIFDLSNRGSICALVTGDVGVERDGGIVLLGRSAGAPPKGCSIDADDLLTRGHG
jgi:acyl-protein synthetase LuxE